MWDATENRDQFRRRRAQPKRRARKSSRIASHYEESEAATATDASEHSYRHTPSQGLNQDAEGG